MCNVSIAANYESSTHANSLKSNIHHYNEVQAKANLQAAIFGRRRNSLLQSSSPAPSDVGHLSRTTYLRFFHPSPPSNIVNRQCFSAILQTNMERGMKDCMCRNKGVCPVIVLCSWEKRITFTAAIPKSTYENGNFVIDIHQVAFLVYCL